MAFWSSTAKDRAGRARGAAERTSRTLHAAILELREMEQHLRRIEAVVPENAPGSAFKDLQRTMELTERYADNTLLHMRRLNQHIGTVQKHLKR
jgi:hypothetical protein